MLKILIVRQGSLLEYTARSWNQYKQNSLMT